MERETQLDTHDIDKLLDDDDFIDDFDFSGDSSDEFVDADSDLDSDLDGELDDELAGESDLDEFAIDEPPAEGRSAGAGVVASGEELASVALEIDDLEFDSSGGGKTAARGLKIVISLAVIFWLAQLFGVLYLLKQPVIIRDEIRPLTAEIDLSKVPLAASDASALEEEVAVAADYSQPEIFNFTIYLPLYSLDGLQVFSAEVEVVQFQESGRLIGAGQKRLQESLRLFLQESIGERLREEMVDVRGHLSSMITPHIENYFNDRRIDLKDVKIRIHNPHVQ
ncbi:MAG: hypothetical protein U9N63_00610 [Pseudomonadota bacterium]|nr:hypothetical protein [Pseudomonadota bacterium]